MLSRSIYVSTGCTTSLRLWLPGGRLRPGAPSWQVLNRELSFALVRCQRAVYRGCANLLAGAAGSEVLLGAEMPCVE